MKDRRQRLLYMKGENIMNMKSLLACICCCIVLFSSVNASANDNESVDYEELLQKVSGTQKEFSWESFQSLSNEELSRVNWRTFFSLCRCNYISYNYNYTQNTSLEGNGIGYIYGQENCPNFNIGAKHMADVGCEIAATYNGLKGIGRQVTCSSIIKHFEKNSYIMKAFVAGDMGSDPYAIADYFNDCYVNYTEYDDFNSMKNYVNNHISSWNVYIVSFWVNQSDVFGGLHTVAFYSYNSTIYVYNRYNNSTTTTTYSNFQSLVSSSNFIVGYRLSPIMTLDE